MSSAVARRQARGEPHCGCHSNSVDEKTCRDHKRLTLTILLEGALVGAVVAITPTTIHNARSATVETSISTPEKDISPLDSQMRASRPSEPAKSISGSHRDNNSDNDNDRSSCPCTFSARLQARVPATSTQALKSNTAPKCPVSPTNALSLVSCPCVRLMKKLLPVQKGAKKRHTICECIGRGMAVSAKTAEGKGRAVAPTLRLGRPVSVANADGCLRALGTAFRAVKVHKIPMKNDSRIRYCPYRVATLNKTNVVRRNPGISQVSQIDEIAKSSWETAKKH